MKWSYSGVYVMVVSTLLAGSIEGLPIDPAVAVHSRKVLEVQSPIYTNDVQLSPVGGDRHRDKSGTSGWKENTPGSQAYMNTRLANRDIFLTERGGFEPPVRSPAHTLSKRAP